MNQGKKKKAPPAATVKKTVQSTGIDDERKNILFSPSEIMEELNVTKATIGHWANGRTSTHRRQDGTTWTRDYAPTIAEGEHYQWVKGHRYFTWDGVIKVGGDPERMLLRRKSGGKQLSAFTSNGKPAKLPTHRPRTGPGLTASAS